VAHHDEAKFRAMIIEPAIRYYPKAYLHDRLARIADVHPVSRIDELMPWAKR
jgi:hypothetical protein